MDDMVPIIAIFCSIGLPVCAFMLYRILAHRERMEMIRHGLAPGTRAGNWKGQPQGPGLGAPGYGGRGMGCKSDDIEAPYVTLRKGIRLTMIGLALTIGFSFMGVHGDSYRPGPLLLVGLIPMFVGLAQVILALLSGASLSPQRQPQWQSGEQPSHFGPVPGPTNTAEAAPPAYDSSYTYRPGDLQELQPPAAPPERR